VKICHVVPTFDPAHGGPLAVATRLSEAQASLGHPVTIAGACADQSLIQNQRQATNANVEVVGLVHARQFEALMPFDLIELHGIWEPILLKIAWLCRRHNVPYVVCPHGMLDNWSLQQKPFKKRLALATFHGRMMSRASVVHALNKHEANVIRKRGFSERIEVIPNGVQIDTEIPEESIESVFPQLLNKAYVLFLGRLHHKKGLDLLAKAWERVIAEKPEATLVLAGPDEDGSIEEFRARISSAGIDDTVRELGAVYGEAKWVLLKACRCFVLPSRQEGFSVAVLEALACGKPVVITRECHFDDVDQATAGIVCDLDDKQLASAILRLLVNQSSARNMGANGKELVYQKYQWADVARRSLDVYSSVLSGAAH
jgi:glycosyltransferase involved in cell wall biosynthesis